MKRAWKILIPIFLFSLIGVGSTSCGGSGYIRGTHVETTHLGKNKKFFSAKYQKSLKKRAKKVRRQRRR